MSVSKASFLVLFVLLFIPNGYSQVIINEIHPDPDLATDQVEFVELYNSGSTAADLSGWSLSGGVDYVFPPNTSLDAGQYIVVTMNVQQLRAKFSVSSSRVFGPFLGRLANEGEEVELNDATGNRIDAVNYQLGFPWPTTGDPESPFRGGSGHSIQLTNPGFDNNLGGSWRSASPSPAARNSVFADNIPPQIRQVDHAPKQPVSGQKVLITAKVTDPDGVSSVSVRYQEVVAGDYIHINDNRYNTNWTEISMHDDGVNGDAIAGNSVYSAYIPETVQKHRSLVRYRISASDGAGQSLTVPYADDPEPNFAYFVYDGVPDWTGANQPGSTSEVTYESEMLTTLPVYHLISSKNEVEECTWTDLYTGNEERYMGTLVYNGKVYDHIHMRARGGVWRYAMGKNMWKFDFNRGHYFQAYNNYGEPYETKWDKLNLGACIQQVDYQHRGEQGMFESVGFRLFQMAGVEASHTHFAHFRVIDEAGEDGRQNAAHSRLTESGTQYDGDFWGLYLAVEQMDGRFLEEHNLPDGNLYKIENYQGEIRNQDPNGPSNGSDVSNFMRDFNQRPSSAWWHENVDLDRYYAYRVILEAIHHYDNGYGKNYYYYNNPVTEKWVQLPWDLDLTWADNMYGNGREPFISAGALQNNDIDIEYQNKVREIRDLLYNPDQTGQLINEMAAMIYTPGEQSFVDADRAMWDHHWVMSNQAVQQRYRNTNGKSYQGAFYQVVPTRDFAGMLNKMKNYVVERGEWIDRTILRNNDIPEKPVVTAVNTEFSVDSLNFETSEFSDPNGDNTFSAMKWRIAEVEPDAVPHVSVPPNQEMILPAGSTWKYFKGTENPTASRSAWRSPSFDDSNWLEGALPVGYGENFIATNLNDMRGGYTTVFLRKKFEIEDLNSLNVITMRILIDDGFVLWINGTLFGEFNVGNTEPVFNTVAQSSQENTDYLEVTASELKQFFRNGTNIVTAVMLNHSIDQSSDAFFDFELYSSTAPAGGNGSGGEIKKRTEPAKYEIEPVWESDEMTTFNNRVTIPPHVVSAGKTYRVRARMKDNTGRWSYWSDPIQFTAASSQVGVNLVQNLKVTELMYDPSINTDLEYIELHNSSSTESLMLDGVSFTNGITYTFPSGSTLPPNGYLLLTLAANESERAAYRQAYSIDESIPIYGPYTGKFSNGGENVELKTTPDGETLISFEYSDGRGWHPAADGGGHSLVPLESAMQEESEGSLDYGGNWRPSAYIGGSPGKPDPQPVQNVVLNELKANTGENSNDWVELYNVSPDSAVNLDGWYLSDDVSSLKKWAIPSVDIVPNGYASFDENGGMNFGLSSTGETLFLSYLPGTSGVDRVVDAVAFKAQDSFPSYARYPDGTGYWTRSNDSRNSFNVSHYSHILIDEIMYHPAVSSDDETVGEYIELMTTYERIEEIREEGTVWRLSGGIEFQFPEKPLGRILIVGFNPNDEVKIEQFRNLYPWFSDSRMMGPFTGSMSNRTDRIALEKLMDIDPVTGDLSWEIIDEVIFFDREPWDREADGTGLSLQRVRQLVGQRTGADIVSGNDPKSWQAYEPSPGVHSELTSVKDWQIY